jgi:two-component system phosphate regulon response regulator PhoB
MQIIRPVILIAERDEVVRDLQRYFLEKAGFLIEFCGDGETAFQSCIRTLPVLVITEILLPKLDGLALCRRLKADNQTKDIPVVVFSILSAGARASEAGADAFLRKPLVESTFVATIRRSIAAQSPANLEPQWASQ